VCDSPYVTESITVWLLKKTIETAFSFSPLPPSLRRYGTAVLVVADSAHTVRSSRFLPLTHSRSLFTVRSAHASLLSVRRSVYLRFSTQSLNSCFSANVLSLSAIAALHAAAAQNGIQSQDASTHQPRRKRWTYILSIIV